MCANRRITDISAQPISDKASQLQITKKRTSTELFELFLNNDVIELIVIYPKFVCCRRRMFWEQTDLHNALNISTAMRHDHFETIF
ncbi:UNVERIFIED_CONTAM: hypothetical protein NCL1_62238 [Trichonephila clavipes]